MELVGAEPAGGLVLGEGEGAALHVAEVAVHGEVEGGIVVLHGGEMPFHSYFRLQFLADFALQGLPGRFAWLHLAAGELPSATPLAVPALGGEDTALPVVDYGGGDEEGFHISSRPIDFR